MSAHSGPRPLETETTLWLLSSDRPPRASRAGQYRPSITLSPLRLRSPRTGSYFRRTRFRTRRARVYRGNKIGVTVSVTRPAALLATLMNCSSDIQR